MLKRTERVLKWDNMKFFLIFCVVMGHISEMYTGEYIWFKRLFLLIYIFHMPAFLFASGLFSKKTIKEKKYKNIFSYLLLYFVIKILRNGVHYLIYGTGTISILSESGVAWYAGALFAYCLVTIVVDKTDLRWAFLCSVIIGCIAGYDNQIGDWLILSRIIVYYPFFLAGYVLDTDKLMLFSKRMWAKITGGIILLSVTFFVMLNGEEVYWLRPLLTGRNPFSKLEMFQEAGGLLRLAYYIIVFAIILAVVAATPNIRIPIITGIGRRTMSVYAFHLCIIDILWGVFGFGEYVFGSFSGIPLYLIMLASGFVIMWFCSLPVFEKTLRLLITPPVRENAD